LEELEIVGKSAHFHLLEEVVELQKLRKLRITGENIYIRTFDVFNSLNHLKELSIEYCGVEIENFKSLEILKYKNLCWRSNNPFPENIDVLKNLKELYFEGEHIKNLPETIANLDKLEKLYINCPSLKTLPNTLGNLKELHLKTDYIKSLPETIYNLIKLEKLTLDCESLILSEEIGQLKNLAKLTLMSDEYYISKNKLPESICYLSNLKYLHLKYEVELPENFGNLKKLEKLVIDKEGQYSLEVPKSIIKISNLTIEYDNNIFQEKYLDHKAWEKAKRKNTLKAYLEYWNDWYHYSEECLLKIKNISYLEYLKLKTFG